VNAGRRHAGVSERGLQQLLQCLLSVEADQVVGYVRIICELVEAISSLRALRENRAARSRRSGFGEDTALSERVVDERPGHVAPCVRVLARDDNNVCGDPEGVEGGA
jgi:hypothetical protein